MPQYALTLTFTSDSERKRNLETAISELQQKGARIIDIQSKAATVGEPPTTISTITITYKASKRIKLKE
jgi:hypothetical protein